MTFLRPRLLLAALLLAPPWGLAQQPPASPAGPVPEKVAFPSFDTQGMFSSTRQPIAGHLLVAGPGAPGAVLNPACEGLLAEGGAQVRGKYLRMARLLHEAGFTVLLVDGFNPRGFPEVCSRARVDGTARVRDALGGLAYLRGRGDVDGKRVVLFSWGAAGAMEAVQKGSDVVAKAGDGFAAAVLFYPDCRNAARDFAPAVPTQVFVGGRDEWNPAADCLAAQQRVRDGSAPFQVTVYPDAYHSFDTPIGEPRMNQWNPRLGMVGRNPAAILASNDAVRTFLAPLQPAPGGSPTR